MTEQQAIEKLVAWCNGEVGYHEGSNNYNKYAADQRVTQLLGWNAQNQAWCDIFTDYAFIHCFGLEKAAEMTYQPIGKGSAACRTSAKFFKDNGAFFYRPQVGDVIFFISAGAINHQGIVTGVSGLSVTTVEGNSSDQVSRRVRAINSAEIAGYGRPKWSIVADNATVATDTNVGGTQPEIPVEDEKPIDTTATEKLPLLRKGDVSETVRAAQLILIGRGYTCGSYGADGDFGNATYSAVCNFQRTHDLEVDGIIGAQTWAALLGVQS